MNLDVALKIYAFGVRFGNRKTLTGLDISKMSDERLAEILNEGLQKDVAEIEAYAKVLNARENKYDFYAQYWTAKQVFYFGLLAMFDEFEKIKPDKNGERMLTDGTIDKLTEIQFRNIEVPK